MKPKIQKNGDAQSFHKEINFKNQSRSASFTLFVKPSRQT